MKSTDKSFLSFIAINLIVLIGWYFGFEKDFRSDINFSEYAKMN